ncbi:tRNA(adenine34) deaminase, partial [Perkinsus olseni]
MDQQQQVDDIRVAAMDHHFTIDDEKFMRIAISAAQHAYDNDEVPVGCAFVSKDGSEVLATAANETNHTRNATRHAELVATDKIFAKDESCSCLRGATLYVTVEPCVMCAAALHILGIGRVVYGCGNDRFGGTGSVYRI